MMAPRKVRWADGPADRPAPGEYLARLWHTRRERVEYMLADGRRASGTRLAGFRMSIETADGRRLLADVPGSGDDRAAPLVESDAPPDLVDALTRAWRAQRPRGRPPGITNIESDEQVRQAWLLTRRAGRRITERNVSTVGGTFTYENLRSYLAATRRTWLELLRTFEAPK